MSVQAIPEGYASVTPHLVVKNAAKAIEFYQKAFGFEVHHRHDVPGSGHVMHAQLKVGNASVMVNDEFPDWGVMSPESFGGTAVTIHLYVADADAVFQQAVDAGAEVTMPIDDTFWGDRYAQVKDPFGHKWSIGTRTKNLTEEEVIKAAAAAFPPPGS